MRVLISNSYIFFIILLLFYKYWRKRKKNTSKIDTNVRTATMYISSTKSPPFLYSYCRKFVWLKYTLIGLDWGVTFQIEFGKIVLKRINSCLIGFKLKISVLTKNFYNYLHTSWQWEYQEEAKLPPLMMLSYIV